ncbi:MAG: hypothetical protein HFJ22_02345 [Clostridia bacterium]|jgi:hypothetical protein|nr:hypothetical protein [Clostridia bacterium]
MERSLNDHIKSAAAFGKARREHARALSAVPQRKATPTETVVYALLPPTLIAAGAMPSTGIFFMPGALCLCYLLYRRFGALMPLFTIAFYGVFSLCFNYDVLSVAYLVFLLVAFGGLAYAAQYGSFMTAVTLAAVTAVAGAALGAATVRLVEGEPLSEVAARYVTAEIDDPFVNFLARTEYDGARRMDDKLRPGDAGYKQAYTEYFSQFVRDEAEAYTVYNCVHFGALFGAIGFLFAVSLNRRSSSCEDMYSTRETLADSVRSLGGAARTCAIRDMRVPRTYLWTCLLPALVAAVALSIAGGLNAATATVTHTFITLPSAFAFVTLMFYFASLSRGIIPRILLGLALAAVAVFPVALFVVSAAGVCDVILNLRYWVEFLRKEL